MTTTREAQLEAALVEIMASPHGSNEISSICSDALSTPATEPPGYVVKPLVFADEDGNGMLTSRETGDLMRVIPQNGGGFFAPGLYPPMHKTAEEAIVRYQKLHERRILSCLAARTAPQPAADTRVVTPQEAAKILLDYIVYDDLVSRTARGFADDLVEELRALAGKGETP